MVNVTIILLALTLVGFQGVTQVRQDEVEQARNDQPNQSEQTQGDDQRVSIVPKKPPDIVELTKLAAELLEPRSRSKSKSFAGCTSLQEKQIKGE